MSRPYLAGATPWPETIAARWRAAGYWSGQTLHAMLADRAAAHPERIAVVEDERRVSYGELHGRALRLATGLYWLGLRAQDRVVVSIGNHVEFFEVCFALFRLGAIPVFALPAHRGNELRYFVEHSRARCYILAERCDGDDLRPFARTLLQESPTLEHVLVAGSAEGFAPLRPLAECFVDAETAAATELDPVTADEVALLQLSGGSTGLPKLIPRTHDEYAYTLRESARICELTVDSRYLAVLPVAHNYPMSSPGCFGVLCAGGQIVLAGRGDPALAFALIERERITITALVPPLAFVWLTAAESGGYGHDLSSLRVLQVGGAPFPEAAARRVRPAFDATLQQVFGMAEGLVNYTRLDDPEELIVSTQGRPISPDDEILVVDDDDRPVPAGTKGHLLTRGPYTIRGYYRAEEHNQVAFTPAGYYRTGDIVSVTPEGYLRVEGRAKDQINRGGEKIAPEEIEDLLREHPDIHDAALVAVPDDLFGERSWAFVVPSNDARITRRMLAGFLTDRGVAAFKIPDQVRALERFPVTGVGKTSRRELRAVLGAQAIADTRPTSPPDRGEN